MLFVEIYLKSKKLKNKVEPPADVHFLSRMERSLQ